LAIARRRTADEGAAYGQLHVQKLQSIEACRRAAFHLAVIYPNEHDRVRSYFRRVTRRPRPAAPAEGEPASATGVTTTGTTTMEEAATRTLTTATASAATPVEPALTLTEAAARC
jgi:hypothetical protein